jgi:putative ABC transport system permease protein
MARRYWPNANPLEQTIQIDTTLLPNEVPRQIVGVVAEVMQYSGQQDRPQLYLPFSQLPAIHDERLSNDFRNITFIVRTPQPAAELTRSLLAAVATADSSQAVSRIRTMHDTAYGKEIQRVYVGLLSTFAAIAVILAVIGVYGVMAQIVSQRTNEIGIRMALGADRPKVRLLVLRQGSLLILSGLFLGALGAIAVTRVLRGLLSSLSLVRSSSTDPLIFAMGLIVLGVIGLLACYLPARRASRIDPISALRHE